MGKYLNGSWGGKRELPQLGKAPCLIEHYGAHDVGRLVWDSLESFADIPDEQALVVVLCRHPVFDAALFVDEQEFEQLKKYPEELVPRRDEPLPKFLMMPKQTAEGLAGLVKGVLR